jgi:hypothetical protein
MVRTELADRRCDIQQNNRASPKHFAWRGQCLPLPAPPNDGHRVALTTQLPLRGCVSVVTFDATSALFGQESPVYGDVGLTPSPSQTPVRALLVTCPSSQESARFRDVHNNLPIVQLTEGCPTGCLRKCAMMPYGPVDVGLSLYVYACLREVNRP